ncbi:hypothetical protein [Persephonella sp.]
MDKENLRSNPFMTNMKYLEQVKDESEFDRILKILTVPSKSGVYISRYDIAEFGKSIGVKVSFRERREMLKDLFIYAKQMDKLKGFIDVIVSFIDSRITQYRELQEKYPKSAVLMEDWIKKAGELRNFLNNLKNEVDIYKNI